LFAFFGWVFAFTIWWLLGFLKAAVGKELGLSHAAEGWVLGVALGRLPHRRHRRRKAGRSPGQATLLASTVLLYSLGSLVCGCADIRCSSSGARSSGSGRW